MITKSDMNKLQIIQSNICEDKLVEIYGKSLGKHLYQKWCNTSNNNIIYFYSLLDKMNQLKLINWINKIEIF